MQLAAIRVATVTGAELQHLQAALEMCMACDRVRLERRLRALARVPGTVRGEELARLARAIEASISRRARRAARLPVPSFPEHLPIVAHRDDIARALKAHQVIVVCGETGSGKTTQLPKIALTLGRGAAGLIGHTQPRRIAARSVAARLAQELGSPLGAGVGYQVRFADQVSPDTCVKVMTDGILLAETQGDRLLARYDTLILDEAHERNLNIDFLLGYLKRLLPRRPDLKVIVTSATIDPERFSRHFGGAPVIAVSGRSYPVQVRYRPPEGQDEEQRDCDRQRALLEAVDEAARLGPGDVLVFLSGEREIRETAEALRKHHPGGTEILPLYARLSAAEQARVFQSHVGRRIVLSTNVAETSLTVPGIHYVIDAGFARISRYSYRTKVQRLPIEKISQASAEQRKGRCGRIAPGVCFRLYTEEDFRQRALYTEPEILRTNLAAVILQMRALNLGDVRDFPFVDAPDARYVNDGFKLLHELGALDAQRALTAIGRELARLPLDPRVGRMVLAARDGGCLAEVLVIAAALSVQDPRERPQDRQQAADERHRVFQDPRSDFLGYLNLWRAYHEQARHLSRNKLRGWCREHFLSYMRMREWHDIHQQLLGLIKDMGMRPNEMEAGYDAIHRALLAGLFGNIAHKTQGPEYLGARGVKLMLFPGSALAAKGAPWVVAAELVETSRSFLRTVARIDPGWVESLAAHLVKRSYVEPHWEKRSAQVAALETVSLYGLVLVAGRKVNYGPIDPAVARELFIRAALVAQDYDTRAPFQQHNRRLIVELEELEAKSRRRDVLVDEQTLFEFFDARVPADIYSGARFERWRQDAERSEPRLLFLTREDLMRKGAPSLYADDFPPTLSLGGANFPLRYHFEPGSAEDGVTMTVPAPALNQLDAQCLEWLVPGLLREKIAALLRSLPKDLRRHFVPAQQFADACAQAVRYGAGSLTAALAAELERMTGIRIPADAWQVEKLPQHLCLNVRVVDDRGRLLAAGRDLHTLQAQLGAQARRSFERTAAEAHPPSGHTDWDFGTLAERVELQRGGAMLQGYPGLVDRRDAVGMQLFDTAAAASASTRCGLRRLFMLQLAPTVKYLRKHLPHAASLCLQYAALPEPPWRSAATPAGGCEALREQLVGAGIDTVFVQGARIADREQFQARLQAGKPQLVSAVNAVCERVHEVQQTYAEVARALHSASAGAERARSVADLREQLSHLVYRGFVADTPPQRLAHLPRYLKGMLLRIARLADAPARDRQRLAEIAPLWRACVDRLSVLRAAGQEDAALEDYRWMLEELRVSLFAQELKTAVPVSPQRLRRRWDELVQNDPRHAAR